MQRVEEMLASLLAALASSLVTAQQADSAQTREPFNRARLIAICDQLETHLAGDEYASNEMLVEHAELLRAGLGENYDWIAEAINGFNYPAALDWLREARQSWPKESA
jgi:hypothetical protein